jgi:hypothetical protein
MKRRTIITGWKTRLRKGRIVTTPAERLPVGNPARIDPAHPKAPKSHPLPKTKPTRADRVKQIVATVNGGLAYAGKMIYDESARRSELFSRHPGDFAGAHADCSQYVASILHWHGITGLTGTDYTGTLLQKGKLIRSPKQGCVAIWGPGTGAHAAFVTEKHGADWYVVGFGHQGAPDRNTLSGMNRYFESVHEPGVRFLEFA